MRISVIGSGAWGSALAKCFSDGGHQVTMWSHDAALAAEIERARENAVFLRGARFGDSFHCTADLREAVVGAEVVVSVTASHFVRATMARAAEHLEPEAVVVSASKGIEVDSLATMFEVLRDVLPGPVSGRLAILSGPSFAREVGAGKPTAVVVASRHLAVAKRLQTAISNTRLQPDEGNATANDATTTTANRMADAWEDTPRIQRVNGYVQPRIPGVV